ncbi:hypothetical protein Ancab_033827 [Ancistrocladus abbreviatus]
MKRPWRSSIRARMAAAITKWACLSFLILLNLGAFSTARQAPSTSIEDYVHHQVPLVDPKSLNSGVFNDPPPIERRSINSGVIIDIPPPEEPIPTNNNEVRKDSDEVNLGAFSTARQAPSTSIEDYVHHRVQLADTKSLNLGAFNVLPPIAPRPISLGGIIDIPPPEEPIPTDDNEVRKDSNEVNLGVSSTTRQPLSAPIEDYVHHGVPPTNPKSLSSGAFNDPPPVEPRSISLGEIIDIPPPEEPIPTDDDKTEKDSKPEGVGFGEGFGSNNGGTGIGIGVGEGGDSGGRGVGVGYGAGGRGFGNGCGVGGGGIGIGGGSGGGGSSGGYGIGVGCGGVGAGSGVGGSSGCGESSGGSGVGIGQGNGGQGCGFGQGWGNLGQGWGCGQGWGNNGQGLGIGIGQSNTVCGGNSENAGQGCSGASPSIPFPCSPPNFTLPPSFLPFFPPFWIPIFGGGIGQGGGCHGGSTGYRGGNNNDQGNCGCEGSRCNHPENCGNDGNNCHAPCNLIPNAQTEDKVEQNKKHETPITHTEQSMQREKQETNIHGEQGIGYAKNDNQEEQSIEEEKTENHAVYSTYAAAPLNG